MTRKAISTDAAPGALGPYRQAIVAGGLYSVRARLASIQLPACPVMASRCFPLPEDGVRLGASRVIPSPELGHVANVAPATGANSLTLATPTACSARTPRQCQTSQLARASGPA